MSTHRLVDVSTRRVAFRPRPTGFVLPGGLLVAAGLLVWGSFSHDPPPAVPLLPLAACAGAAAVLLYLDLSTPRVFDLYVGRYWRSRIEPLRGSPVGKNSCRIDDVYALQLLRGAKRRHSPRVEDVYYELNLVLSDATRLNVVSHGDARTLRRDAVRLAEFLNVPIWDAIVDPAPQRSDSA